MRIESMLRKNKSVAAITILAFIILLPVGYYAVRDAFSRSTEPFLEKPAPKNKECVRDTDYMRFHHWELLKEIRVDVVREGKRSDITLEKCRECHVNRARFCDQCHSTVNFHPDCFGCHNYPEWAGQTVQAQAFQSGSGAIPGSSRSGR